jgi:hypothetical protein
MAWSGSKVERSFLAATLLGLAANLESDTLRAALFNNTITPDNDATAANAAYGAGQWASGEVSHVGQWAAGGIALANKNVDDTVADVVFLDADDVVSGSAATLVDVYGVKVYDDTIAAPVANPGISYNYLGGVQSVTLGTFTVVWSALGIARMTL